MMKANRMEDAALGAFLGACVGDAAGATLEFLGRQPEPDEVAVAMHMKGGGVWRVAPGQITDDCELALSLARGLAQDLSYSLETIAEQYAAWIGSDPFDIGTTTIRSLGCFQQEAWRDLCESEGFAVGMTKAAQERCMESKSNGSLMRNVPLGIWGYRLEPHKIAEKARQDSLLSHPNPSCCDAVACYSIAVGSLLREPGNAELAFQLALDWAEEHACEEVQSWLRDASQNVSMPYHPLAGFVAIGFGHAFRHLLLQTPFEEALRETLEGGGDTDTNACIVGGLLGALWGAKNIPERMKEAVLECDTRQGRPRPDFLHPRQVPTLVQTLLQQS